MSIKPLRPERDRLEIEFGRFNATASGKFAVAILAAIMLLVPVGFMAVRAWISF